MIQYYVQRISQIGLGLVIHLDSYFISLKKLEIPKDKLLTSYDDLACI